MVLSFTAFTMFPDIFLIKCSLLNDSSVIQFGFIFFSDFVVCRSFAPFKEWTLFGDAVFPSHWAHPRGELVNIGTWELEDIRWTSIPDLPLHKWRNWPNWGGGHIYTVSGVARWNWLPYMYGNIWTNQILGKNSEFQNPIYTDEKSNIQTWDKNPAPIRTRSRCLTEKACSIHQGSMSENSYFFQGCNTGQTAGGYPTL